MSIRLFETDVLFLQRLLSCCGVYSRRLDGVWGQHTDQGERDFDQACNSIAAANQTFDSRSERNIRTLDVRAQPLARQSLAAIRSAGIDARIISGTRTYAEQAALFRQGRFGNPGDVVTKARAGQSWHNFGLAWDIGIFQGDAYLDEGAVYDRAGALGKIPGVEWGGDWSGFKDKPHFEAPFGAPNITVARTRFESGNR